MYIFPLCQYILGLKIWIKLGALMRPQKRLLTEKEAKDLTPMQAFRQNCLECTVFQPKEIAKCGIVTCPCHQYRFGKNPRRKGIGNKNISPNSNSTK